MPLRYDEGEAALCLSLKLCLITESKAGDVGLSHAHTCPSSRSCATLLFRSHSRCRHAIVACAHRESLPPLFPAEGMGLLAGGGALPYPTPHVATAQRATTLRTKDEGDNEGGEKALLPLPIVLSQSEDIADTPSPLQSPLHFLKTTKEI